MQIFYQKQFNFSFKGEKITIFANSCLLNISIFFKEELKSRNIIFIRNLTCFGFCFNSDINYQAKELKFSLDNGQDYLYRFDYSSNLEELIDFLLENKTN